MEYVSEVVTGVVLLVIAAAFRAWATTLRETADRILERLDALADEFHTHRLKSAERLARVESDVKHLLGNNDGS